MRKLFVGMALILSLPASAQVSRKTLEQVLGAMPTPPPLQVDTLEKAPLAGGMRYKLRWLAEAGDERLHTPPDYLYAYLFAPKEARQKKVPGVIAIHQDGNHNYLGYAEVAGLGGDADQHYGLELFERGYIVLCPDRFLHGPRRRIAKPDTADDVFSEADRAEEHWCAQLLLAGRTYSGKEVYDLKRATDVLCQTKGVDTARLGALGHSAGGYALGYFMFSDRRIKAGVSSCGVFELLRFYDEHSPRKNNMLPVLPGLLAVGSTADYIGLIAPRPFLMTRGLHEWGDGDSGQRAASAAHVANTRALEAKARARFVAAKAGSQLVTLYFEENGGAHSFPPKVKEEVYRWLDVQLKRL